MSSADLEDLYPLSPMQEGLLFHTLLDSGAQVYFRQMACELQGDLDEPCFRRAWQEVVDRNPALRTSFLSEGVDEPIQAVFRRAELPVVAHDWREFPDGERESRLAAFLAADERRGFDLGEPPLMRLSLLRTGERRRQLVWSYHHLLLDGWSVALLLRDVFAFYNALRSGVPLRLQRRRPYRDYIAWLQTRDSAAAETFWRRTLAGFTAPTPLGAETAGSGRPHAARAGREEQVELSAEETVALQAVARERQLTLNTLVQGAWALLLGRYSGELDVVFGAIVSGRPTDLAGFEEMVGLFINTLPVRVRIAPGEALAEWLRDLQARQAEARQHDGCPLVRIQGWSEVPRGTPLFESLVAFESYPVDESLRQSGEGEIAVTGLHYPDRTSYPLTLIAAPGPRLQLRLLYDEDRFSRESIRRRLAHLQTLLTAMAGGLERAVADVPILTPAERGELLASWNGSSSDFPHRYCLHERFSAVAATAPEAVALVCGGETLTWGELSLRSNRLANHLRELGVGPEVRVGLLMERSVDLVVALLGILKAGGAYVPLDPAYPRKRVGFVLNDSGAAVVVTEARWLERLPASGPACVCLDRDAAVLAGRSDAEPASGAMPESLAYVIYTSGSTGTPKGVLVSHSQVIRLLTATEAWFGFGPDDVWTLFHSVAFDFSVWEIWGSLLYGGRLVVVPPLASRSPEAFHDLVCRERVTVLNQTPTAFRGFMQADTAAGGAPDLRLIIFGGEALDPASLEPWFQRHGDARPRLVNMYGITETTVHVTYRPLSAADGETAASAIGGPIPDLRLYLLDPFLDPVPPGVAGEIYVGGAGLARGYLGRPDLTAERFLPDPFARCPGGRFYRSGDRGLCRRPGDVEYLGRLDQQVKIRGFRVELGEIEAAVARHPAVRDAAVVARQDEPGEARIVAYLVPAAPGAPPSVDELRRHLTASLPEPMIPSAFVIIEALPLTSNGKLDRRALPAPGMDRPRLETTFVAPRSEAEEVLAKVWADVLGLARVGVHDNFFALGGDSIRSIQVRSRAELRGLAFSLQDLFETPTVAELARRVEAPPTLPSGAAPARRTPPFGLVAEEDRRRLPEGLEDAYPLSRLQAGMVFHSELAPGSATYHDVFSYHLRAPFDEGALSAAVEEALRRHPVLRTSFDLASFSEPLQLVHRAVEVPLSVESLEASSAAEQEEELRRWLEAESRTPFDWGRAPLFRLQVHRRGASSFQLTFSFHHAILDGWSVASLLAELFRLYLGRLGRTVEPVPPAPCLTFGDFVALEREALESSAGERFWDERLADAGVSPLPRWPASEPPVPGTLRVSVPLAAGVPAALHRLARESDVPVRSVLLAAHLRALGLLSGHIDVTSGIVTHGRPEGADGDRVLGLFLNTLPVSVRLAGGTWRDLVREVFRIEREMLPHRRHPLAKLLRRRAGHPLFEVNFNFVHFHVYDGLRELRGIELMGGHSIEVTNHPLTANFSLAGETGNAEVRLDLIVHTERFPAAQIDQIAGCYAGVLAAMAAAPDEHYELSPLPPEGDLERLAAWNCTGLEYPSERSNEVCLHELLARQAERSPDRTAVVFGEERLTYRDLDARANRLAHFLVRAGVGVEAPVGICLERSLEMAVAILGVMRAGAAYVPLDPSLPLGRLEHMARDVGVRVVLTVEELLPTFPEDGVRAVCLDREAAAIASESDADPASGATADHLAYILFTSGSTGLPKAVMVTHRAIGNRLLWMQHAHPLADADAVLFKTPFSFDASIWELFVPLIAGARVVIARPGGHQDPGYLLQEVERRGVTVLQLVPSLLPGILDHPGAAALGRLRRLFCGGEALSSDLVDRVLERFNIELVNLYGPTETSIDASSWTCRAGFGGGVAPIGRPLANLRVHILDAHLCPVPVGTPGELYVAGVGLARGYFGKPHLTAERFVPDPFAADPGGRSYRTGDVAAWRPDGLLEYQGRADHQVKVRGVRIEPAEIEALLRRHPAVREAVVLARPDVAGDLRLIAYFVPRGAVESAPLDPELRTHLRGFLPEVMLPAAFVQLTALPLSPNGKLDRSALPAPDWERRVSGAAFAAPRTPIEKTLAEIWSEVLGVGKVGVHDSFFELGGHSLLALPVIARVRKSFGIDLPLAHLFEEPTVERLAVTVAELLMERIEELSEEEAGRLLTGLESAGPETRMGVD
jgi:amino acid adenylation domain-containing protein